MRGGAAGIAVGTDVSRANESGFAEGATSTTGGSATEEDSEVVSVGIGTCTVPGLPEAVDAAGSRTVSIDFRSEAFCKI
jgi:hypothetical protein